MLVKCKTKNVVSDEVYDQIVKDIIKLLERKYPSDANWYLDS